MSKFYFAFIVFACATMMVACGNKPANADGETEEPVKEQVAEQSIEAAFAMFDMDYAQVKPEGNVYEDFKINLESPIYSYAFALGKLDDYVDAEVINAYNQRVFDYCKTVAVDGKLFQIRDYAEDKDNPREVTSADDAWQANGRMATAWRLKTKDYWVSVYMQSRGRDKEMGLRVASESFFKE